MRQARGTRRWSPPIGGRPTSSRPCDRSSDRQQEDAGKRLLAAFAGDPRVTLGGNPVANHEISTTIERRPAPRRAARRAADHPAVLLHLPWLRGEPAGAARGRHHRPRQLLPAPRARRRSPRSRSTHSTSSPGSRSGSRSTGACSCSPATERSAPQTPDLRLALRRALPRAGHTIVFSALTVAASLACLLVFPLRFLRSMGYGGIVASTVAMLDRARRPPDGAPAARTPDRRTHAAPLARPDRLAEPVRHWRALGQTDHHDIHPGRDAVVAVLLLVAAPIVRIRWTTVDASSLPSSAQAFQADACINHSSEFVRNSGTPFYLALETEPAATAPRRPLALAGTQPGTSTASAPCAPPRRLGAQHLADQPHLDRHALQRDNTTARSRHDRARRAESASSSAATRRPSATNGAAIASHLPIAIVHPRRRDAGHPVPAHRLDPSRRSSPWR